MLWENSLICHNQFRGWWQSFQNWKHSAWSILVLSGWKELEQHIVAGSIWILVLLHGLTQNYNKGLEASVKIHFQSSGNIFQHNREQHNMILHIWLECIGGFFTLSKNNLLGLGYGLFSLHKPHLIHRYQEVMEFKHMCVLGKHRQDDMKTLQSPWQDQWGWRQCRSHNEQLTAKDFTRGILHSIWATQDKIKDQGQENWVQASVALARLTIGEHCQDGIHFWTNWRFKGWGEYLITRMAAWLRSATNTSGVC